MKYSKVILSGVLVLLLCFSCFFDRKQKVDAFYITRNYGQFPLLPLANPVVLYYDTMDDDWGIDMLDYSFKQSLSIQNIKNIGVYETYIYGKIDKTEKRIHSYKKGAYVFLDKYNYFHTPIAPREATKDEIRVFPIDNNGNKFIMPERWFILNVADSSTTAFFSKKKYEDYLKSKGISGKMYDIDKYHKQYKETGILPWFPDSVKVKLRK